MLFPPLGRNAVITQFQQRKNLSIWNRIVQQNRNPVIFIHMVSRKKALFHEQRTNHDGTALNIHHIKRFFSPEPQLFREDVHHGGKPFFAGRMTEHCVAWAIGPKVFRFSPIGILYMLRDTFTLRIFSHVHYPETLCAVSHTPTAPPQSPHGRRTCRNRGTVPAVGCG